METKYTRLSALVDDDFTVEKSYGYKWKKYDPETKRFLIAEQWEQDFKKVYTIVTDKGTLDISAGQMGNLLEAVHSQGKSDLIGRTFHVKSNGKTGMDIRYYLNPTKSAPKKVEEDEEPSDDFDMSSIPF